MAESQSERRGEPADRNLAMEPVRVTEAVAMAAGRWVDCGHKNGGDGVVVDGMRHLIGTVSMRGIVVIGEGEKDEAPMLYNGEQVGNCEGPWCDVAVDPIDGTTLMAKGMPNALAVLAVAERDAMFDPSAVFYMEKLAVGPAPRATSTSPSRWATTSARSRGPRRSTSGTSRSPSSTARATSSWSPTCATPAPGSGSSPTATWPARSPRPAHHRRRHGRRDRPHPGGHHRRRAQIHGRRDPGRLWPKDDEERAKAIAAGHDLDRVLTTNELRTGENPGFSWVGEALGERHRSPKKH